MRKMWRKLFGTAALAFMLCLTGLVMSGTAFANRCVDNDDGTVTDNGTGLMWQKATAGPMQWPIARNYAEGLSLGGHSGWGLPTKDELVGLYNSPCKSMMDVRTTWYLPYWSSSYPDNSSEVLAVRFDNGRVTSASWSSDQYMRGVRRAQ